MFVIKLYGKISHQTEPCTEEEAYALYEMFKTLATGPDIDLSGVGVQLIHNGLCVRELVSNVTESSTTTQQRVLHRLCSYAARNFVSGSV
jgi:hypothetical protein